MFRPTEWWSYRELLYFLALRDIKVRYRQTAIGAAWAILQPLGLMLVFTVFLGHLAHVPSEGTPYALFAYAGLVPWTLFASAIGAASDSLVTGANLVSKVYFPRIIAPIAAIGASLVDFAVSSMLLIALGWYYSISLSTRLLLLPVFSLFTLVNSMAVGIWLSALNVKYRDVKYAVPFLVQIWLFVTPVAYAANLIPKSWRLLYSLNPMAGAVEGFRWSLIGRGEPPSGTTIVSMVASVIALMTAVAYFQYTERTFADII